MPTFFKICRDFFIIFWAFDVAFWAYRPRPIRVSRPIRLSARRVGGRDRDYESWVIESPRFKSGYSSYKLLALNLPIARIFQSSFLQS